VADENYANHELFQNTETAPPPEDTANVQARDEAGRFVSESSESAPESDENLEAVADVEASEDPAADEAGDSEESDEQETAEDKPKPRRSIRTSSSKTRQDSRKKPSGVHWQSNGRRTATSSTNGPANRR